jgi:hypothetical protein
VGSLCRLVQAFEESFELVLFGKVDKVGGYGQSFSRHLTTSTMRDHLSVIGPEGGKLSGSEWHDGWWK